MHNFNLLMAAPIPEKPEPTPDTFQQVHQALGELIRVVRAQDQGHPIGGMTISVNTQGDVRVSYRVVHYIRSR